MRMDFLTLKLFVAVAEENSIANAAAREHLVPSAVSKRLGLLEASLGVELLVRHAKGVTLTPAGETLLQRARDILRSVEATMQEIAEYTSDGHAHIRLTANHSSMAQFLPGDLASFLAAHPRVKLDLVERLSADVVRAVADGLADVGIYCWPATPQRLIVQPYRSDELVVAASLDHPQAHGGPIAFELLAETQFIAYYPNLSASAAMPEFLDRAASRIRLHVANFEATCRMVEAGLGVAILPRANVDAYARQGRLACIELTNDWAHRRLHLCMREDARQRGSVVALMDHLARCARQELVSQ
jgi:DNA-binding transcriptional LysR family regulator